MRQNQPTRKQAHYSLGEILMDDLRSAAREACIYCVPLIELAHVRTQSAALAPQRGGAGINAFIHLRALATPADRWVTSPNVDTLYSHAFVDLGNGPATVALPATGERYFSLHLLDMYTNSFAVLGTRTTGNDGGTFMLVGPHDAAPDGAIRAPTSWIWALVRIGANDSDVLDAIHKMQDEIVWKASPARVAGSFAKRDSAWDEYFSSASALLAESPPPATDLAALHRIAPLGLGPSRRFDASQFTAAEKQEIEKGVVDAKSTLTGGDRGKPLNGWIYPSADQGVFGQNYLYRARSAVAGLGSLPRQEAMYMRAVAPDGGDRQFQGGDWRLNFPVGQLPPVDAFWSLTMYEATPEGQSFLTENPLHRYAIGDRTKGLKRNADGSLDIWIARQDPGGEKTANWLPAPASGPYRLIMRTFLPKQELLAGTYLLPPLMPA
jgi:hypothetical protein